MGAPLTDVGIKVHQEAMLFVVVYGLDLGRLESFPMRSVFPPGLGQVDIIGLFKCLQVLPQSGRIGGLNRSQS